MAEIVNLRQARKAAKRGRETAAAAVNRAKFGQTKGDRLQRDAEAKRREQLLEGAKRDSD